MKKSGIIAELGEIQKRLNTLRKLASKIESVEITTLEKMNYLIEKPECISQRMMLSGLRRTYLIEGILKPRHKELISDLYKFYTDPEAVSG